MINFIFSFTAPYAEGQKRYLSTKAMKIGPSDILEFYLVMGCGSTYSDLIDNKVISIHYTCIYTIMISSLLSDNGPMADIVAMVSAFPHIRCLLLALFQWKRQKEAIVDNGYYGSLYSTIVNAFFFVFFIKKGNKRWMCGNRNNARPLANWGFLRG